MDRLPIKFEEEVLNKHGIEWSLDDDGYYKEEFTKPSSSEYSKSDVFACKHEIAGIALEAILKNGNSNKRELSDMEYGRRRTETDDTIVFGITGFRNGEIKHADDEDFCECVFKEAREIWGEKVNEDVK